MADAPGADALAIDAGSVPVDPYRTTLYTAAELYDAPVYADSLDARTYAWSRLAPTPTDSLAQALHDHAVDQALTGWLTGRHLVGVMGGHDLLRGERAYAQAAHLGGLLGVSHTVATGGGPGAMEAANLGGRLAHAGPQVLDEALSRLAGAPSYHPSVDAWVSAALPVATLGDSPTLGIPTWFYGHEPPNVFCDGIGKYFSNAIREDGLLARTTAGLVVLEGAAGTVQEIFQAVTPLYYAPTDRVLPPLVLVGERHWSHEVPVWPALLALGRERALGTVVHLVDTVDEAAAVLAV
jgi:predicted Rossmann-fold nucleotide-binding protein